LANKIAKQYNIDLPSGLSTPTNSNPLAATNQNHTVATAPNQTAQSFQRTLKAGMSGNDVKALQVFLNAQGFMIAKTGVGSPGHETHYFGPATKAALIKFQNANADTILKPQGLTEGTGFFGEGTRRFIKERY
jgi:peptidoglycan hydrolase-like protein with peptidoglycan-binding domain